MKKLIVSFFAVLLIGIGIFLVITFVNIKTIGKSALEVVSNVKADVFLNGEKIGTTPLCKCEGEDTLNEGEYELTIKPLEGNYEDFSTKVKLPRGIRTIVDRTFLPNDGSSVYILSLDKISETKPQMLVVSIPEGALISIDGSPQGITPYFASTLPAEEHDIELQKDGYNKKTLRVKAIPQHKLIVNVILGKENLSQTTSSPSSTLEQTSPIEASGSGKVVIQETPTGFLRVRSTPSITSSEVARIQPGESFMLLEEQNGWYKIELQDKNSGWISSQYAEKQ